MDGYYINISLRTTNIERVYTGICLVFEDAGFKLVSDEAAADVVEDEGAMPDGDTWYGVIVSGLEAGWVTVYVDDWKDSGLLAHRLSQYLETEALEVWVAEDVHWGYTYYERGEVIDRFADSPAALAESAVEQGLYHGKAHLLLPILLVEPQILETQLRSAQSSAGQFSAGPIDTIVPMFGLPFEQIFMGYSDFLEDDPEDYSPDLATWSKYRHLAFQHPQNFDSLS